jgi:hypothetical protein
MSSPEKEPVIPVQESWLNNLATKVNPVDWIKEHVANLSATSLHIISVILLHSSTIPTLLSLMFGISDKTPILDMVLLLWAALLAMFAQALIQKNYVIVTVITVGFMIQSVIMALIFFR